MKNEQGYHLFYRSHQNALPIQVLVDWVGRNSKEEGFNVIRLYDIWLGEHNKSSTITDLRTGYTNQADITADEFKLLVYAGLDKADWLNIGRTHRSII